MPTDKAKADKPSSFKAVLNSKVDWIVDWIFTVFNFVALLVMVVALIWWGADSWPRTDSVYGIIPGETVQISTVNASFACPEGWYGIVTEYVPMPKWWKHFGAKDTIGCKQMITLQKRDELHVTFNSYYHDDRWKSFVVNPRHDRDRLSNLENPFLGVSYDAYSLVLDDTSISATVYIYGINPEEMTMLSIRGDLQDGESVEDLVERVATEINLEFH